MDVALIFGLSLLAWWAGTGVVLAFARAWRPVRLAGALLATGLLAGILTRANEVPSGGGVGAVAGAVAVGFAAWLWIEWTFYAGLITGLRVPGSSDETLPRRFHRALLACLWHEIAALVLMGLLFWLSPGPEHWAAVVFFVFWALHQSARLNVLAGVPRTFEGWLPRHLEHLADLYRPGPSRGLLEGTIAVLATITTAVFLGALDADPSQRAGWVSVFALMVLGVVEHVALTDRVDLDVLWGLSRRARSRRQVP